MSALVLRLVSMYLVSVCTSPTSVHGGHRGPYDALRLLGRLTNCAVIFAIIELVKTVLCRVLALRVHSSSLFETLQV